MSKPQDLFQMNGVLKGIRVVEQGTFITGPAAGVLRADLGAEEKRALGTTDWWKEVSIKDK